MLLVRVFREAPDFRAGAAVAEAVSRLVPGASCDIRSLLKEAEAMEKRLKKIRSEPATGSAVDRQKRCMARSRKEIEALQRPS